MARRSLIRAASALSASAALALTALAVASPAQAGDLESCVTKARGTVDITCYEFTKAAGTKTTGRVRFTWRSLEGSTWTNVQGGLWMVRTPIAGERTGSEENAPNANSDATCNVDSALPVTGCWATFSGPDGSIVLDFPLSTAGYKYQIMESEFGVTPDGDQVAQSGNDANQVDNVWVHRTFTYKYKGKTYTSRTCPPRAKKACTEGLNLVLNDDVGTGVPISPTR